MTAIDLHTRHIGFWKSLREGLPGIVVMTALFGGFFGLVALRVLS